MMVDIGSLFLGFLIGAGFASFLLYLIHEFQEDES